MKRILCHLAQRNPDPKGAFFRHVSRCRECQEFFKQVAFLEEGLVASSGEPDADLCRAIMAKVSLEERSSTVQLPPAWRSSRVALPLVAGTLVLVGILVLDNFRNPSVVVKAPESGPAVLQSAATDPPPEVTFAYVMQQQKFLQKDALKLGTHLREHLILFRAADK